VSVERGFKRGQGELMMENLRLRGVTKAGVLSSLLYSDFNRFYFCAMINWQFSILLLLLLGLQ